MKEKVVAGIDIGGTNTKIGLVTSDGKIVSRSSFATGGFRKATDFVASLSEYIRDEVDRLPQCELHGIGIGSPNGNFFNGTIEFAPNLRWKGIIPLVELFRKNFSVHVALTNDAKAAALGEKQFGGAKQLTDFLVITLGTGLGSGIFSGGKLLYGHDGFAGELGHTIIIPHGRQCGCGRRGCLEQYVSATGMVKTFLELHKKAKRKLPVPQSAITARSISELSAEKNSLAVKTIELTAAHLGLALANAVVYLSPQVIFLFGGVAQNKKLIQLTEKNFRKNVMRIFRSKISIRPSQLFESDAAILGAASLIWNQSTGIEKE